MGPTDPRPGARRPAPPSNRRPRRPLETLLRRRLRAARDLGVPAPGLTSGPTTSPRGRLAALDRRIARELDLAGGKQLPPWDEEEEDDDEDLWTPSFRHS
jgi:hypothetical protein